jgi:hypothetical protein
MHRQPSVLPFTTRMWPGLHGWLALVLLVTGFMSWSWARTSIPMGKSEMVYFMSLAGADTLGSAFEPAGPAVRSAAQVLTCSLPQLTGTPTIDQVYTEIADQDIPSCPDLWLALMQGVPAQGPQPELPQTERQPLLRPPARLG